MRKPAFCICENNDADQCLCFHYTDSTIPLLSKSEISSLWPSSVEERFSHNEAHIKVMQEGLNYKALLA